MILKRANDYFQLFSCCIPVKGAARSILCDLQRQDFLFIPNEFADIFLLKGEYSLESLLDQYADYSNFKGEFLKCIELLVKSEYGFYSSEPTHFPEIDQSVIRPETISNAIIDIDDKVNYDLDRFITELSKNLCKAVVIRYFRSNALEDLSTLLNQFVQTSIRSLEVYFPFCQELESSTDAFDFLALHPKCKKLILYKCTDRNEEYSNYYQSLVYTEFLITPDNCCGFVSPHHFKLNHQSFFESRAFNNCLHKKVSIDKNGAVCNCPSMKSRFGHFDQQRSLNDVLENAEFTQLWSINKDQVKVCRDCEFRYICHDCRAFVKDQEDPYSKPKHCHYNPYVAQWEET